ncbi:MAG: hypothetical protein AAF327_01850 [Cyanobacteria bacterium P01_A01_bin.37]
MGILVVERGKRNTPRTQHIRKVIPMLNQLIIATEIAFAAALLAPVVHTAIWVLSPIWTQPVPATPVPDLGAELEPKELTAHIERVINQLVPSVAASIAESVVAFTDMKVPALRQECAAKGITWRNAHGKNAHLKKGEMVAALETL